MIFRQISNRETPMLMTKKLDPFSFMPSCIVDPQFYSYSGCSTQNIPEKRKEPDSIAFFRSHHPMFPTDRINPTEHIQPFLMLVSRHYRRLRSFFAPYTAKLRMYRKTSFISEQDYFSRYSGSHVVEFFLLCEHVRQHLLGSPEHIGCRKEKPSFRINLCACRTWMVIPCFF
jgi:hypothetical protein